MKLKTLYVRFFRSFNYDYLRKSDLRAEPDPWDLVGEDGEALFYPFVRIPMERDITTVVGANESGKSQLLGAIERLLTGRRIESEDFCRYSDLFVVDKEMSLPEFGGEFSDLSEAEGQWVRKVGKVPDEQTVESFCFFRFEGRVAVFVKVASGWSEAKVATGEIKKLTLPSVLPLYAHIPLPDSVPLAFLIDRENAPEQTRKQHLNALGVVTKNWKKLTQAAGLEEAKAEIVAAFSQGAEDVDADYVASLELAEKLLVQVAGIDRSAFRALANSEHGTEGFANGIVDKMNDQLADALNFPQWWSQDSQFSLTLTLRDFDLVFTVRDRTGRDYSFKERSGGMRYFLSYFVQYLSHLPSGGDEILLMDEPDAYLSSQGQQDLLGIFEAFAYPPDPDDKDPVQVVYVTHSPFLIDKNHGERIRALQKGDGEEGTRVVANAAHNHYEPLRSAFGAFVAETTFIGNCNLMMEGQADQILLAGISSLMRRLGSKGETLDLNTVSLVPAGSAEHIPYMVYLARGRDVDTPAVVVLLDGDGAADEAAGELRKGYRERRLIEDGLIIQVKDLDVSRLTLSTDGLLEIEDLLTAEVCEVAVKRLAGQVLSAEDAAIVAGALGTIAPSAGQKLYEATQAAVKAASKGASSPLRLGKVAFARAVMHALEHEVDETDRDRVISNFEVLFGRLNEAQRLAMRENDHERTSGIINRAKKNFWRNHPKVATKRDVQSLLEDMESKIPDSGFEAETMRAAIIKMRSDFKLAHEPMTLVEDFDQLRNRLDALAYAGQREVLDISGGS